MEKRVNGREEEWTSEFIAILKWPWGYSDRPNQIVSKRLFLGRPASFQLLCSFVMHVLMSVLIKGLSYWARTFLLWTTSLKQIFLTFKDSLRTTWRHLPFVNPVFTPTLQICTIRIEGADLSSSAFFLSFFLAFFLLPVEPQSHFDPRGKYWQCPDSLTSLLHCNWGSERGPLSKKRDASTFGALYLPHPLKQRSMWRFLVIFCSGRKKTGAASIL